MYKWKRTRKNTPVVSYAHVDITAHLERGMKLAKNKAANPEHNNMKILASFLQGKGAHWYSTHPSDKGTYYSFSFGAENEQQAEDYCERMNARLDDINAGFHIYWTFKDKWIPGRGSFLTVQVYIPAANPNDAALAWQDEGV